MYLIIYNFYSLQAMDLFDIQDYFPNKNAYEQVKQIPSLVMGANTDQLFPIHQQREMADKLKKSGSFQYKY